MHSNESVKAEKDKPIPAALREFSLSISSLESTVTSLKRQLNSVSEEPSIEKDNGDEAGMPFGASVHADIVSLRQRVDYINDNLRNQMDRLKI